MDDVEARIQTLIEAAIKEHTFPGAVVGYADQDRTRVLPFGHLTYEPGAPKVSEETVYDLASITKVIPTNSIILSLIEKGLLSPEDQVIKFIPEMDNPDRDKILIKHLLTFTVMFDLPQRLTSYAPGGKDAILNAIYKTPLKYAPGQQYSYSNAPIILLGIIAERILNQPLDQIADEMFFAPLQMVSTTFHPERLNQDLIAPSEINDRGEVRGQVHDETAWVLHQAGMIGGHAGAFSSARDLLIFGQMLLAQGEYNGRRYFDPSTVEKMSTELVNDGRFGMALGWEMNQSDYMGPNIPTEAFGKDGFTGTMILIEPMSKKCLVMLSNRTYPQRPENPEAINRVRRSLVEMVLA
jgi:CubicO group peptidase (beta-lactamase class C family)